MNKNNTIIAAGLFFICVVSVYLYFQEQKTTYNKESVRGSLSVEEQLYNSITPSNVSAHECDLKAKEIVEKEVGKIIGLKLQQFAYDTKLKRCFGLRSGVNSSGNYVDEVEDIYSELPLWSCEMLNNRGITCAIREINGGQGFKFVNFPPTPGIPPTWYEFKKSLIR